MYINELAFAALKNSELQKVDGKEERVKVVEDWMAELGLEIDGIIQKKWGTIWNIHPDQIPDIENALLPDVERSASRDMILRSKARILMIEGPTEMIYHVNRHVAFRVMEGAVALYTTVTDTTNGILSPEKYVTGQQIIVHPADRYAWMPLPDGKNGFGLPKTVILAELWLTRMGEESSEGDEEVVIDPYKKQ